MLVHMEYKADVSAEEQTHFLKQSLADLEFILSSTRPVGQQFYQGQPVWNKRMLTEEDVLNELHNNSIFTTACSTVETFVNSKEEEKLAAMLQWFWDVCDRVGGGSLG